MLILGLPFFGNGSQIFVTVADCSVGSSLIKIRLEPDSISTFGKLDQFYPFMKQSWSWTHFCS